MGKKPKRLAAEPKEPKMAPSGSGPGNTIIRPSAAKNWCFTWNNYPENAFGSNGSILGVLGPNDKYIIGKEIGKQGTPHLQGFLSFNKKCRPMESLGLPKQIHWEKMKGTIAQNFTYCTKDGEFMQNVKHIPKDPLKGKSLHKWQSEMISEIKKEPDDRTVNWVWSEKGKRGKTAFMKHVTLTQKALMVSGKCTDVKFAINKWFESETRLDVVFFHFSRSVEGYVSYDAIESVKDGIFFSGKYESGQCIFDPPHVICLANFPPDKNKLSADRWNIIELK